LCHEEFKEKKFELELSWICPESNNKHEMVPKSLREDAEKRALESIEEDQMAE
jgi:20S proteasome subunit alpha 7